MDCRTYCMFLSGSGAVFLLFVGFLVAFNSKTLYVIPNNRFASAVALFFSAIVSKFLSQIYGCIFGFIYYQKYINVGRLESRRREMEKRRHGQTQEDREMEVLKQTYRTSVATYK